MDAVSVVNNFIETVKVFLNSGFFLVVKFFIAIYIAVLFVDLILLMIVRGIGGNVRTAIKGVDMPTASKKKQQKRWADIEARLKTNEGTQLKLAILEADGFANEILGGIGYKGKNMKEKLEGVTEVQLSGAQSLRDAHNIRNEIINNRSFFIEKDQAQEVISAYRNFLDHIEII